MQNVLVRLFTVAMLLSTVSNALGQTDEEHRKKMWAADMAKFEQQDAEHPAAEGGVLFVGSSSIRMWDLEKSFPDLSPRALNRGFGGSQLIDSIQRVDALVIKYKPRLVLIYAGDNDIADGKNAERVVGDFKRLAELIHQGLPEANLAYIAIKPSIARWKLAEAMNDANQQIANLCEDDDQLAFINIWEPMLGDDGKPRPELFLSDGLHLNDKGYEVWASLVAPKLEEDAFEKGRDKLEEAGSKEG